AKQFEARPRVRVLLELAAGANELTNSGTRFKVRSSSFPLPDSTERTWFLGVDGALLDTPGAEGTASYRPDPAKRRDLILAPAPAGALPEGSFEWSPVDDGDGLGFVSEPLTSDVV